MVLTIPQIRIGPVFIGTLKTVRHGYRSANHSSKFPDFYNRIFI